MESLDIDDGATGTDVDAQEMSEALVDIDGVSLLVLVAVCKLCGGPSTSLNPLHGSKCMQRGVNLAKYLPWLSGSLEAPRGNFCVICYCVFFAAGFSTIHKKIAAFRSKAELE